jgi:hypothetical protein
MLLEHGRSGDLRVAPGLHRDPAVRDGPAFVVGHGAEDDAAPGGGPAAGPQVGSRRLGDGGCRAGSPGCRWSRLFRWARRHDWDIVHSSLEKVSAAHLAKEQIGNLSGGQRQRIFIARALAQQADLLLMDEPLNGLDLPSQEKIFEIWNLLQENRVTVMVATHDLNLASDTFDQVMLLNKKLLAFGRPPTVLTSDNLLRAYGGHLHLLDETGEGIVLVDDCCDPVL